MSIFYCDLMNGNDSVTATPLGWWSVAYTNGNGTQPVADEQATGNTSGRTAKVTVVTVSSGTWAGGNAAGTIYWYGRSGAFVAETLTFGGGATCSIAADLAYCAWKTWNSGATSARTSNNDVVRTAKTDSGPTSVGNALWTNKSRLVVLSTAQTADIDMCETAWTRNGSGDTTVARIAVGTDGKQGSYSMRFTLDTSPQTSIMQAYYATGALNLSAYQKISFWIKNSTGAISANQWEIALCSDTAGATVVDTFAIPAIASSSRWVPLTIARNGGGNLGSSIQSISIRTGSVAPANSAVIFVDDFIACTTNGLNLQSLLTKDSTQFSDDNSDGLYPIQSISGTNVYIDNETNTKAGNAAGKGYYGTTETVTTYFREGYKPYIPASATTSSTIMKPQEIGVSYSGGWDPATNEQNGDTIIDFLNGNGIAIEIVYSPTTEELSYISHFSIVRAYYGVYITGEGYSIDVVNCIGNVYAIYQNSNYVEISDAININNNTYAFFNQGSDDLIINKILAKNCITQLYLGSTYEGVCRLVCNEAYLYNGTEAITTLRAAPEVTLIKYCEIKSASITGINVTNGITFGKLIVSDNTANWTGFGSYSVQIRIEDYDQNSNLPYTAYYGSPTNGYTKKQAATAGGTGYEWLVKLSDNNVNAKEYKARRMPIAKLRVNADAQVTATVYVKKSSGTSNAKLYVESGDLDGVDLTETTAPGDTVRNQLSLQFTPTQEGVITIWLKFWGSAGNEFIIDDFDATQED